MTDRRDFLKLFAAGLAAAAVIPGTAFALPATDRDRLEALLESGGEISGATFVFRDGLPIELHGMDGVSFYGCEFIWEGVTPTGYLMNLRGCSNFTIVGCAFITRPDLFPVRIGLYPCTTQLQALTSCVS